MPIFAVIRQSDAANALPNAIAREYPNSNYNLGDGAWLVAGPGTAKDVADKLGVTPDGASGTAVIIESASYYGRANPAIWSWIKTHWEAASNG